MKFSTIAGKYSKRVRPDKTLYFDVFSYNIGRNRMGYNPNVNDVEPVYLSELLHFKLDSINEAFEAADLHNEGLVSSVQWEKIMAAQTELKIHWISMIPVLVPSHCVDESGFIHYKQFMENLRAKDKIDAGLAPFDQDQMSDAGEIDSSNAMINALYTQHKHLETVFNFFDLDQSGVITRDHFISGCDLLNKTLDADLHLPESCGVKKYDELFDLLDIDETDDICMNSFFELYRIVHTKDKNTDAGVDDEGNVHLGLGEIIIHCDSDLEISHKHEHLQELMEIRRNQTDTDSGNDRNDNISKSELKQTKQEDI